MAPQLATIIAGMCAGADSIDDIEVLRAGGHKTLFTGVYAPSTLGQTLREFTPEILSNPVDDGVSGSFLLVG